MVACAVGGTLTRDERLAARGDVRARLRLAIRQIESGCGPRRDEILWGIADRLWLDDFYASRGVPGRILPAGVRVGPWEPTHRITFRPDGGGVQVIHVGVIQQDPDEDGLVPAATADEWMSGADSVDWGVNLPQGCTTPTGEEMFSWRGLPTPHGVPGRIEVVLFGIPTPLTPPEAYAAAEAFVARVEAMNGVPVEALCLLERTVEYEFGRALARLALGGVAAMVAAIKLRTEVALPSSVRFLDLVLTMS